MLTEAAKAVLKTDQGSQSLCVILRPKAGRKLTTCKDMGCEEPRTTKCCMELFATPPKLRDRTALPAPA